jgi:hypothetical protein
LQRHRYLLRAGRRARIQQLQVAEPKVRGVVVKIEYLDVSLALNAASIAL